VVDPADLVVLETVIDDKAAGEGGRRGAGMAGPTGPHLVEIDVEHDASDIEQQHVGGAGRVRGLGKRGLAERAGHGSRLQNWTTSGNAGGVKGSLAQSSA